MAKRSGNATGGMMSGYNATLWRVRADGSILSVSVVELSDGRVQRHNGRWTGRENTPGYHAEVVHEMSTWLDEHCDLFTTDGTKGFTTAITSRLSTAWEAHKAVASRLSA